MAQILLAYDGSDHSKKALDKALDMLYENDELIVLYVVPAALKIEFEVIDPAVSRAKAHEMVNKAIEIAVARGKSATGLVKDGDISEVILNFASEIEASLIVIGSMGISKIGRFSLGSVAERVTRHADRPVLIVR